MARSEARIDVEVWDDPDFLALSPGAQRAFMFLLSQKDLAHTGVLALRERRWSHAARGLTVQALHADLAELADARFIVIDEDTEELLIRSFIRRDKVYRQPNVLRAAADHLPLITSPAILAAIRVELLRVSQAKDITEASQAVAQEMLAFIEDSPIYRQTFRDSLAIREMDESDQRSLIQSASGVSAGENPSGKGSGNPSDMPTGGTPGERGVVTVVPQGVSPSPVPRAIPLPAGDASRAARQSSRRRSDTLPLGIDNQSGGPLRGRSEPSCGPSEGGPRTDTAQTLIGEWIDRCPKTPPRQVAAQVGKHLKSMLSEGIDADDIRRGLLEWSIKGLHPSTLPSIVNEIMNATGNGLTRASPKPHDQREYNGLMLSERTISDLERRKRLEAMDAAGIRPLVIEGLAP